MGSYIGKQLAQTVFILLLISAFIFFMVYVSGDPTLLLLPETASDAARATLRAALGLDQPLHVQYVRYLSRLVQGDFGDSFRYGSPALPLVMERLPATLELAAATMAIAVLVSIPLGILSATRRNSALDVFISGISVIGKAMPTFWLGIMLILIFSVRLQLFPVSGHGTPMHLALPAITLSAGIAAQMTRLIRSSMLDILAQDYIRTARGKGLGNAIIYYKHALRNALIPFVTIMALQTSGLIGGTLITEVIFAWPGLGQLLITAINYRDMAIVQATVFVIAIMVIASNWIADMTYRFLDPRIKQPESR